MKFFFAFSFLLICFSQNAQSQRNLEYILKMNGDSIKAEIIKIREKFIKARVNYIVTRFRASDIKGFYSKDYKTDFESHPVGFRGRKLFLGKLRDGEVILFCRLKPVIGASQNTSPLIVGSNGTMVMSGGGVTTYESDLFTLEGKPYFRYKTESKNVIHVANKIELFNIKDYECFALMVKLLNGLDRIELGRDIRDITFRDLIIKYNNECEAKLRDKEYYNHNNRN